MYARIIIIIMIIILIIIIYIYIVQTSSDTLIQTVLTSFLPTTDSCLNQI